MKTIISPDPTSIILGNAEGLPVPLPVDSRLHHVFMLGSTGSGKSRLLLHFMRQAAREGFLFLDPHGSHDDSVYRHILSWLAKRGKKIHVIDLDAPNVVGFNPLYLPPDTDPSVIAGNVMDAFAIIWGNESFSQKPTIERVLYVVLIALIELKLTLPDMRAILDKNDAQGLRARAISEVSDPYIRSELQRLDDLAGKRGNDFDKEVLGPLNRVARFLVSPFLRDMLGRNGIDFRKAMDDGDIILVNLSAGTRLYETTPDILGALIIRTVLFEAKRRAVYTPYSFIIDEAHRFLTPDIENITAELRKYGISLVVSVPWLAKIKDENIRSALLNINCKICFRLNHVDDAEIMAKSMIPLDLERPVGALIKPTVVGQNRTWLRNDATSEHESHVTGITETEGDGIALTDADTDSHGHAVHTHSADGEGETEGSAITTGSGSTQLMLPVDDGALITPEPYIMRVADSSHEGESTSKARNRFKVRGTGESEIEVHAHTSALTKSHQKTRGTKHDTSKGKSKTLGESEALESVFEDLPTAVHSLQNELYVAGQLLHRLPTSVGYLSYTGKFGAVSTLFQVPIVPTYPVRQFEAIRDRFLPPMPTNPPTDDVEPPTKATKCDRGKPGW